MKLVTKGAVHLGAANLSRVIRDLSAAFRRSAFADVYLDSAFCGIDDSYDRFRLWGALIIRLQRKVRSIRPRLSNRATPHISRTTSGQAFAVRSGRRARRYEEYVMVYRTRFGRILLGAAIMFAAATAAGAGASAGTPSFGHSALAGHRIVANELVDGWKNDGPANPTIEPDPTDDGNIVVECVAFLGGLGPTALGMNLSQASVPQRGLGPSKCPPFEFRRIQ